MAKLHEVLAVEAGLQTTAKKIIDETIKTFGKKDEHFVETVKVVNHFADEDTKLDTVETKAMVTTVWDKLKYAVGPVIRAYDSYLQKEATNQVASADLVVDDKVIAASVPATVLLGLESKLTDLRAMYEAIPTLAPGPVWVHDSDRGAGVWRSQNPAVTFRTRKTVKPIVLAPATKEHPAQVQPISEDVPVAKITTTEWSGMLSSSDKSVLLGRVDKLIRAVKRARQRANGADVVKRQIGDVIFDYIHGSVP